jgi:hypothetical protein
MELVFKLFSGLRYLCIVDGGNMLALFTKRCFLHILGAWRRRRSWDIGRIVGLFHVFVAFLSGISVNFYSRTYGFLRSFEKQSLLKHAAHIFIRSHLNLRRHWYRQYCLSCQFLFEAPFA